VLSDEEFWIMGQSIFSLQGAFDKRYRNLMEGWRQQRLNIELQLESFAAGMFESWHNEYYEGDDVSPAAGIIILSKRRLMITYYRMKVTAKMKKVRTIREKMVKRKLMP
jgi:hypothetical protein